MLTYLHFIVTEYCDINWEHVVVESKKESSWLTILQYIAVSIKYSKLNLI